MTWDSEAQTLRAPVFNNWDFSTTPVLWELEGDDVSRFLTSDRSSPGEFMLWRVAYGPGEYLAGGNNAIWKHASIDCRIHVEAIARGRADQIIRSRADDLHTYYGNASDQTAVFRTPEAMLTELFEAEAWAMRRWVLPVWIFSPGPGDELLAGQSDNQLTITQAGHGFAVGDWIGYNGSSWVKAQATSGGESADGVVSAVADTDTFTVTTGDIVKVSAHGLTQGVIYLSTATAGEAQTTAPGPGDTRQRLGKAVSADYLLVDRGEMF